MERFQISHHTRYTYSTPVTLGPQTLRLRPRGGHDLRIIKSSLVLTPEARLNWARDVYGNSVATAHFDQPTTELAIISEVSVEHYDIAPLDFFVDDRAVNFPFLQLPGERIELMPYLTPSYLNDVSDVASWTRRFWQPGQIIETYVLLDTMNRAIASDFTYRQREEPGVQRPSLTLNTQSGSCRDFAALLIEACRFLGLPARFVSGYASTEDIPAALGATHAWTEIYLPGVGWKGFDSTSGGVVGPRHIAVAVGRDPESLPPISGTFYTDPGQIVESDMVVSVRVLSVNP